MTRLVLVLKLDPTMDVEGYRLAGRLESTPGVESVEVRSLEDGDDLIPFSLVKEGITRGLQKIAERYQPEQAGSDSYDDDEERRQSIAEYERHARGIKCGIDCPTPTPEELAERERRRVAERAEQALKAQAESRAKLEAYDQAAERVATEKRIRRSGVVQDEEQYTPAEVEARVRRYGSTMHHADSVEYERIKPLTPGGIISQVEAIEIERRRRLDPPEACRGGCSRGGEGPACGRSGCRG